MNLDDAIASRAAAFTRTQVAALLDVDERTVTRAIDEGQLPAIRLGRRVLVPRLPLLALLGASADAEKPAALNDDPSPRLLNGL